MPFDVSTGVQTVTIMERVAIVLGAGIQGVCVSLMLQKHGYHVDLIDQSSDVINRTSLTYEGKIHLGFHYGMDSSLGTGQKIIKDALQFASYIEYLLGENVDWGKLRSRKNIYLVHTDSMLPSQRVEDYFTEMNRYFQKLLSDSDLHYLGERPNAIFKRVDIPEYVSPDVVDSAILTEEVSIDQTGLKEILKRKISESSSIDLYLGHRVSEIAHGANGIEVRCRQNNGSAASFRSDLVFNCLWESRIYFDQMMGLEVEAEHSIRLKYGLLVKADEFLRTLHSVSIIHGAYGNFVINPRHGTAYFSWYPSCMKGMMKYGAVPEPWEQACEGHISDSLIEELRLSNFENFRRIIPGLTDFEMIGVKAGLILAEGMSDITEKNSRLHNRNETPVRELNGYFSVNTSKFTSAPRNTMCLEHMLFDWQASRDNIDPLR